MIHLRVDSVRLFQVFNLLETLEVSMIFIHFFVSEFNLSLKLSVHLRLSRWVKCAAFHTGIKNRSAGIVSIILKYIVLLLSLDTRIQRGSRLVGSLARKKLHKLSDKKESKSTYEVETSLRVIRPTRIS